MEVLPIRWTSTEGWFFNRLSKKWEPMHPAECTHNGRELTKQEFNYWFRNLDLPPLPKRAFQRQSA